MAKNRRHKYIKIDVSKLIKYISNLGLTLSDVSIGIGHDSSYMRNVIRNGELPEIVMLALEYKYNIKRCDIALNSNNIIDTEKSNVSIPFTTNNLEQFFSGIYGAVYKAMIDALNS